MRNEGFCFLTCNFDFLCLVFNIVWDLFRIQCLAFRALTSRLLRRKTPRNDTTGCQSLFKLKMRRDPRTLEYSLSI